MINVAHTVARSTPRAVNNASDRLVLEGARGVGKTATLKAIRFAVSGKLEHVADHLAAEAESISAACVLDGGTWAATANRTQSGGVGRVARTGDEPRAFAPDVRTYGDDRTFMACVERWGDAAKVDAFVKAQKLAAASYAEAKTSTAAVAEIAKYAAGSELIRTELRAFFDGDRTPQTFAPAMRVVKAHGVAEAASKLRAKAAKSTVVGDAASAEAAQLRAELRADLVVPEFPGPLPVRLSMTAAGGCVFEIKNDAGRWVSRTSASGSEIAHLFAAVQMAWGQPILLFDDDILGPMNDADLRVFTDYVDDATSVPVVLALPTGRGDVLGSGWSRVLLAP